ncbi:MAG TPA: hypothetical protein VH206_09595 [Xanthobacteraceae bacterium]|nr:hypothetical protein [Xanthobacteraceae bacterium]
MPPVHNFPPTAAFRDESPDSPITEFALRVVVELPNWQFFVVGTATIISGYLAVTALHVFDHVVRTFGATLKDEKNAEISGYEIKLYQVVPGPAYRIWRVVAAWPCATDIVLLHLSLAGTAGADEKVSWKQPFLRVMPPPVGQQVVAFGYRESKIAVTEGQDGVHRIEVNDRPTTSIGTIRQV